MQRFRRLEALKPVRLAKRRGLEREIAIGDRNVRLCTTLSFWAAA